MVRVGQLISHNMWPFKQEQQRKDEIELRVKNALAYESARIEREREALRLKTIAFEEYRLKEIIAYVEKQGWTLIVSTKDPYKYCGLIPR